MQIYYTKEDLQLKIEALQDAKDVMDIEIQELKMAWNLLDHQPEGTVCDKKLRILKQKPDKAPYYQVEKIVREAREERRKKMVKQLGIMPKGWN